VYGPIAGIAATFSATRPVTFGARARIVNGFGTNAAANFFSLAGSGRTAVNGEKHINGVSIAPANFANYAAGQRLALRTVATGGETLTGRLYSIESMGSAADLVSPT
jgi:hypothetical protein